MSEITLESDIPSTHPDKQAIEDAIVAGLKAEAGPWKVKIICSRSDVWWVMTIKGPGFDWAVLLKDPKEQRPEFLVVALQEALSARRRHPRT